MDAATSLDRSEGNATATLYRAAIGSINTGYYERVFTRFEEKDRSGPSWNWTAALTTLNWMVFRKLWGAALAYAGAMAAAALLVLGIGRLVVQMPPDTVWSLLALLGLASVAIPGFYGNALLHAACRKRMVEALATTATVEEACAALQTDEVTVKRMLVIAMVNLVLVGLCFAVYRLMPVAEHLPADAASMGASAVGGAAMGAAMGSASMPAARTIAEPPQAERPAPATSAEANFDTPASAPAEAPSPAPIESASAPLPLPPPPPLLSPSPSPSPTTFVTPSIEPKAPPKAPNSKKYFVNVGLFADENNALNAYTRLSDAGLASTKTKVKGTRGTFTRVRAGPYATPAEATKAAEKIRALQLDAVVVAP